MWTVFNFLWYITKNRTLGNMITFWCTPFSVFQSSYTVFTLLSSIRRFQLIQVFQSFSVFLLIAIPVRVKWFHVVWIGISLRTSGGLFRRNVFSDFLSILNWITTFSYWIVKVFIYYEYNSISIYSEYNSISIYSEYNSISSYRISKSSHIA